MTDFEQKLAGYKKQIDADIDSFAAQFVRRTQKEFGEYPAQAVKSYQQFLTRGGKRIRGVLAMHTYFMFGGKDSQVAIEIARAIEMLHAYILAVDDIQDRSETRRGGPTVHIDLKNYHINHTLKGDPQHFGESVAMNAFLFGMHSALDVIADMNVSSDLKIAAIKNVNKHFIGTAHGQTLDIFNEVVDTVSEEDVNNVLLWKTALYTFANPMQLGAILAGADEQSLKTLEQFSLHAGKVFQITDDILGVFGEDEQTGKHAKDDIIEGKRTILTTKALEQANEEDAGFLEKCLDNTELTDDAFERCKQIITDSGALDYAKKEAHAAANEAKAVLKDLDNGVDQKKFLENLLDAIEQRSS